MRIDPEQLRRLLRAFDCTKLDDIDEPGVARVIAERIIAAAKLGKRDPAPFAGGAG
jgi:hypothetical protein